MECKLALNEVLYAALSADLLYLLFRLLMSVLSFKWRGGGGADM